MAQATQKHHRPIHQRRAVAFDPVAEIDALIIEPSLIPDLSFLGSIARETSVEYPVVPGAESRAAENITGAVVAPDVGTVLGSELDTVLRLPLNTVIASDVNTVLKSGADTVPMSPPTSVPPATSTVPRLPLNPVIALDENTVLKSETNTVLRSPQASAQPETSTVPRLLLNTVIAPDENTVLRSEIDRVRGSSRTSVATSNLSTVLNSETDTVLMSPRSIATGATAASPEGDVSPASSVIASQASATAKGIRGLDALPERPCSSGPARVGIWVTEAGEMVVEGRVQRINHAKDMLTGNEALVYELLWKDSKRKAEKKKHERGPTLLMDGDIEKLVQAGHNDLRKTGLSQSTIRRVRQSLLDKDFIVIEQPPDILRRTPTIFRVFSFEATLKRQQSKGRFYQAKIGPGHSFVWPLQAAQFKSGSAAESTVVNPNVSTVVNSDIATVVNADMGTPSEETIVSMVSSDMSTVFETNTLFKDKDLLLEKTTATDGLLLDSFAIRREFARYALVPDQRALTAMIAACQSQVPDLTTEELNFFLREKGSVVRSSSSVENPTGFLLKVVPRCFEGDPFREWRKQRQMEESATSKEVGTQAAISAIHEQLDAAPANNFWARIKSFLRQTVNPHTFDWLVPLRYLRLEAGKLFVWMPGEEWRHPAHKLREQIFAAIRDLALPITQIQFVTDEQVPELCGARND